MAADWIIGKDQGGKLYLFQQGASDPSGARASTTGLTQWFNLGGNLNAAGAALNGALAKLGASATQQTGVIQAIDAGSVMQGSKYVAFPAGQTPGSTLPGQGQAPSASEAVGAGIDLGGITSPLNTILAFAVRALEFLAGAALLVLGLQALTGTGAQGNPAVYVKRAGKAAAVAAA